MIAAAVFDLFGTLLDIGSLAGFASPIVGAERAEALVALWREKQLGYAFAASLMRRYEDFDAITALALDYAAASLGIELDARARTTLCDGWLELRPYPDAVRALETLLSRKIPASVLTNGTLATAKRVLHTSGLDEYLDAVWSVDEVKEYKPSPSVYGLASSRLRLEPRQIAFVSANGWDATGASAFGFAAIWCNRRGLPAETFGPPPLHAVTSLDDVAGILSTAT